MFIFCPLESGLLSRFEHLFLEGNEGILSRGCRQGSHCLPVCILHGSIIQIQLAVLGMRSTPPLATCVVLPMGLSFYLLHDIADAA